MRKIDHFGKSLKVALACLGIVATSLTFTSCEKDALEEAAPLSADNVQDQQGATIPGKYIVVFKEDVDFGLESTDNYGRRQEKMHQAGQGILRAKGIPADKIEHVYGSAIKGMALSLSGAELQQLRHDPRVAYIEKDRVIKLAPPAGKGPNKGGGGGDTGSLDEVPWGVNRVGGAGDGTGKVAWIIDTGIDLDHPELNVNVAKSRTFITTGPDADTPDDFNGHGSHVSGTIAAKRNNSGVIGVAAGATVVAVKVLDRRGSGSYSGVIAGVDYVKANGKPGDVANMSLGGPVSKALDDAVKAASGTVKFALAAGNDGDDANNHSPARANGINIYTVSAIDVSDRMPSWSNWGNPPVDYAAPGVSIKSTWKDGGYNTISGTSMATPHVAGLLLLGAVKTDKYASGDPDGKPDPIAHR